MKPIRIFISSVQKELELERAAVAALISTDPFLLQHCVPVRFDKEPPPPRPAHKPYLAALKSCQAYVLILANEYGDTAGELSATHEEYRLAQKLNLPSVVFLKGATDDSRKPEVKALIREAKKDGFTYKRFHDREDLRPLMLAALRRMLAEEFDIHATDDEVTDGEHQVEAASPFESAIVQDASVATLDEGLLNRFNQTIATNTSERIFQSGAEALHACGLAISGGTRGGLLPTTAAFLVFAPKPANRFPQCEILADAYETPHVSGRPKGQMNINAPLPLALEQAEKFVNDVTFHPHRVVGLNNVRLNEYPVPALREALVNAMAHRNYGDAARKILLRVYSDRLVVSSPGYPLKPLTPARLRKGGYSPCSRNPMIAQTLATFSLMEQRGTGFARMRDAMLDHGLDEPKIDQQDGFFVVTLPGPAGNFDRIRTPASTSGPVTPAIEAQLNERQRKAMSEVFASGSVTSGWMVKKLKITYDTANRDLIGLAELKLLARVGRGRASKYVPYQEKDRQ
jgi:predicted HTH transcriptional regulator